MKNKKVACKCGCKTTLDKLILKMGGLICTKCRVIVYYPGVDPEYSSEVKRRRESESK